MELKELQGTYQRAQGEKRKYTYRALFRPVADGFIWDAKVHCDGELKGTPEGHVESTTLERAGASVKSMVEECIERLVGVEE